MRCRLLALALTDASVPDAADGAAVYAALTRPGAVAFDGASGRVRFDANGDRSVSGLRYAVDNWQASAAAHRQLSHGAAPLSVVQVGSWSRGTGYVQAAGAQHVWPGGSSFHARTSVDAWPWGLYSPSKMTQFLPRMHSCSSASVAGIVILPLSKALRQAAGSAALRQPCPER